MKDIKLIIRHSMRHFLLIVLLLVSFLNVSICQNLKTLKEVENFGNNPGNLKMFIHNSTKKETQKLPLVVVLHGCGQDAVRASELTGWNKLADLNNFLVLYPQQKMINNPDLCFNWFNNKDIEKGKGECESIFQMISYTLKHYAVDSSRIFITGLSAGAAMSIALMATYPELFKTGAVFEGGAYKIATNPIVASKGMAGKVYISREKLVENVKNENPGYKGAYPHLIIYQGMDDAIVNNKNATLLVNQWTGLNKADTIVDETELSYSGIDDITRKVFRDSSGTTVVILYEVNDLGHRLMIKPGEKDNESGKTGIFGVDKGFNSTYKTAEEFGITKKKKNIMK